MISKNILSINITSLSLTKTPSHFGPSWILLYGSQQAEISPNISIVSEVASFGWARLIKLSNFWADGWKEMLCIFFSYDRLFSISWGTLISALTSLCFLISGNFQLLIANAGLVPTDVIIFVLITWFSTASASKMCLSKAFSLKKRAMSTFTTSHLILIKWTPVDVFSCSTVVPSGRFISFPNPKLAVEYCNGIFIFLQILRNV